MHEIERVTEREVIEGKSLKILEKDLIVYTVTRTIRPEVFECFLDTADYAERDIKNELSNCIADNVKITSDCKTNTFTGKVIIVPFHYVDNEWSEQDELFGSRKYLIQKIRDLERINHILTNSSARETEKHK